MFFIHQPLFPFYQEALKMLGFLLTINSIAHSICYLWRKVAPNEGLLGLISNFVFLKYRIDLLLLSFWSLQFWGKYTSFLRKDIILHLILFIKDRFLVKTVSLFEENEYLCNVFTLKPKRKQNRMVGIHIWKGFCCGTLFFDFSNV